MRKLMIIAMLLVLPAALFAQLQVGGTALYNFPYLADSETEADELSAADFTFGVDARLKILLFQGSALALFTPGAEDVPGNIDLYLDGGVAFDILFFRLGLGAGPNFRIPVGEGETTGFGLNVKATADVMLGDLAVGLSYLNKFELDFDQAGELLDQDYTQGLLGVSVLVTM
ncbi:MAG: hypothetical protein ACOCY8_01695 [Spirochaetota bacterium]